MLVVAPLRVARQTWPDEIAKWDQFSTLRCAVLNGPKKDDILKKADADIYTINPEGLFWLCHKYFGRPLPFDVLVIDELTKFKNSQSERSKRFRPRLRGGPRYRWGLTGSLAGDGDYLDVFGQQLMLDDGAALGRFITHYRDKYFSKSFDGFTYNLNRGAEKEILARLAPYWFYMNPADYSELPPLVDNPIFLTLEPADAKRYKQMKDDYVATLPGRVITAANAGAAYGKLAQMANGAVYDSAREVHHIHDLKIEALNELVDELNGAPLLVGYEFNHDLARLQKWHEDKFKRPLPYLGAGTSAADEGAWVKAWNENELPILAGHPASMGHGLNLQGGSAQHVCWFSMPWSYELFDQFVRRVRRSGNESEQVFNHMLIVKSTIDEDKLAARDEKGFTQDTLMRVLNAQIISEARKTGEGAGFGPLEREEMVQKLSRPAAAPQAEAAPPSGWGVPSQVAAPSQAAAPPAGWGVPSGAGAPAANGWGAPTGEPDQRERVRQQIAPSPQEQVSAAFGQAAQQQAAAIQSTDYNSPPDANGWGAPPPSQAGSPPAAEPAKRTRRTKAEIEADNAAKAAGADAPPVIHLGSTPAPVENLPEVYQSAVAAVLSARVEVLKIAFADPNLALADGIEIADELWKWASALPN